MVKAAMYNGKEGQRKNCVYEEYVGTVESAIKAKVGREKSFVYAPGQLARGGEHPAEARGLQRVCAFK